MASSVSGRFSIGERQHFPWALIGKWESPIHLFVDFCPFQKIRFRASYDFVLSQMVVWYRNPFFNIWLMYDFAIYGTIMAQSGVSRRFEWYTAWLLENGYVRKHHSLRNKIPEGIIQFQPPSMGKMFTKLVLSATCLRAKHRRGNWLLHIPQLVLSERKHK